MAHDAQEPRGRGVRLGRLEALEQRDNVLAALSLEKLNPAGRRALTEGRLSFLLRRAPREATAYWSPVLISASHRFCGR